jgi:predicted GNAT family acetyltransferase
MYFVAGHDNAGWFIKKSTALLPPARYTLLKTNRSLHMADTIHDNVASHRFELEVEGHIAFVAYKRERGIVTLVHTEVPKVLAGRGIGGKLAKGVLDLLRANGAKIVVECPFIASYIEKHPEYRELLAA